jgi:hypothetical protein
MHMRELLSVTSIPLGQNCVAKPRVSRWSPFGVFRASALQAYNPNPND